MGKRRNLVPRAAIPESDHVVVASRCQRPSVRRVGDAPDFAVVASGSRQSAGALRQPVTHNTLGAPHGDDAAVGRQSQIAADNGERPRWSMRGHYLFSSPGSGIPLLQECPGPAPCRSSGGRRREETHRKNSARGDCTEWRGLAGAGLVDGQGSRSRSRQGTGRLCSAQAWVKVRNLGISASRRPSTASCQLRPRLEPTASSLPSGDTAQESKDRQPQNARSAWAPCCPSSCQPRCLNVQRGQADCRLEKWPSEKNLAVRQNGDVLFPRALAKSARLPSFEELASSLPSREKRRLWIESVCPRRMATGSPVPRSGARWRDCNRRPGSGRPD